MDRAMGRLLQTGVLLAGAVVLLGESSIWRGMGARRRITGISTGLRSGSVRCGARCADVIEWGVLLMIATPVLRVAFCVVAFAVERDWKYTAISAIVLGVLGYGIFGSH